ncbi:alpha 1,2 mannosyltransferase [Yamadazyma tenuis]|uniref:Mannosyltransferase n=1 Tax=Candida tenuis (strain ATCC 10573 / BCRC 21748 / CBS 615 / JCM 9827 / NBRC 10315 / NRRL Y-1498 / VKM Y-70) TaxID=590646 RepID=G3AXJ4_CANTC|nr:uncharacterized protein CANTEDRAFT_96454 [Yamadazyma tenuis ATCC 10573]EGV66400.1 hypothetical protein CANTEDRAFT_96454 [Yamadazyma tenuis ATCC 10573]WEJ95485.1 alpha 1,2 mannosyltransferase [Yamadazyma tenuis]
MSSGVSWRQVYIVTIILRFILGISDSYIHPDEHFQNFEVLASKFFGFSTTIPWEFESDLPARSFGPLYLFYGPLFAFIKFFGVKVTPKAVWYMARLQLIFVNWLVTDMCLYRLLPTKPERVKAVFFTSTSYITLVLQSHCFSNSLETPLVLISLLIISDLRFDSEVRDVTVCSYDKLFYFGIAIAIGIFNRVTFPAFLVIPSYFLLKYIWKFKIGLLVGILGFMIPTTLFIFIDTYEFKHIVLVSSPRELVITPLNNLIYNSSYKNLALHGIHPFYTHVLINLPQVFGPLLCVLFYKGRNNYYRTVPFLSFVSGLTILSFVPHQELRFLMPLLPIASCCIDFSRIMGVDTESEEIKEKIISNENNLKPDKVLTRSSNFATSIIVLWYLFNIVMCLLMGILHQGGVIPALDYSHANLVLQNEKFVQIWWRTYSPPTWLLGSPKYSTIMVTLEQFNTSLLKKYDNLIIDAMGSDQKDIYDIIKGVQSTNKKLMLVAPVASINCDFESSSLQMIWKYSYHLDLDHLNFESLECLAPGLGIYEII